jgi:hypothetical protein
MAKVISHNKLPKNSILLNGWEKCDYLDCFSVQLPKPETVDSALTRFFGKANGGVVYVSDENNHVKKYRLGKITEDLSGIYYPIGSRAVLFNVINRTKSEIVLGEEHKHLDFRTTILVEHNGNETIMFSSTAVRYNKPIGKLYFFFVKPFHSLLIKLFLKWM